MCYPQPSSHLPPFSFSFRPLETRVTAVVTAGQLCFQAENCTELCQKLLKQAKHSGSECMVWKCNHFPVRYFWGKSRAAIFEIKIQCECWVVEKL